MEISNSIISILDHKPVLIWINKAGIVLQTNISFHKHAYSSESGEDTSFIIENLIPQDISDWVRSTIKTSNFVQSKKHFQLKNQPDINGLDVHLYEMDEEHFSITLKTSTEKIISLSSEYQKEEVSRLLLHLASDFMSIDEQKLDFKIQQALKMIGLFAGADRSYILIHDLKKLVSRNTHE